MAPRGRPRRQQSRLMRMDAAIDAMVQFGFSEDLVRTTVKDLLKEYGGDEGWPFIEGDAYKLLIETILDEQEKCGEEENLLENDSLQEGGAGDNAMAIDARPSGEVLALTCSEAMATAAGPSGGVLALACSEVVDTASETINTEINGHLPSVEGDGKGCESIGLDQNCHGKEIVNATGGVDRNSRSEKGGMHLDNTQMHSSAPVLPSPPPATSLPTRRRKPCYGWISSDDDEPDDFIKLTPMIHVTERQAKRKTRWDVRPGDM